MNDKASKLGLWLRRGAAGLLSLMLVFSLIQPGLARADAAYICGKEEHTHSDDCYETKTQQKTVQVLKCSLAEAVSAASEEDAAPGYVHTHGESCYVGEALVCPLKEVEAHTHGAECYGKEPQCGLEEVAAHWHSDACQKELTCTQEHEHTEACYTAKECTLEETAGHTHTAECYNLTCEKPEIVLHEHDENCYAPMAADGEDKEPKLTCTTPEVIAHVHDENCYEEKTEDVEVKSLTCGLEEHTHTDACVQKPEEEVEEKEPAWTCGKETHTHAEGCYDVENTLTCTLDEHTHTDDCVQKPEEKEPAWTCGKEAHTHAEGCYDAEKNLTCTLEEHTHTDACEAKQEVELKVVTLNGTIYTDNTYKTKAEDQTVIAVTGKIPEGASVRAFPVELEAQEGKEILFAYDIEIVLKDGTIFQPAEGETVTVDVQSEAVCGAETEVEVYHAPETGEHEKMTATETEKGISFDTKHFSIYYGLAKSVQPAPVAQNVTITEVPSEPAPNVTINMYNYPKNINSNHSSNYNAGFFFSQSNYLGVEERDSNYEQQASVDGRFTAGKGISTYYPEMKDILEEGKYPTTKSSVSYKPYYDDEYHKGTVNTQNSSLFQKKGNYYLYDSKENAAYWDQDENEFVLYDHIVRPYYIEHDPENLVRSGNFLPFNKLDASTVTVDEGTKAAQLKNEEGSYADLWFGMTVDFEFYMPKDGMVGGDAMEFDFHGDDDVFVYIGVWNEQNTRYDYKLVLDIGGTHPGRSGTINFQTGAVTDFPAGTTGGTQKRDSDRTKTEPDGVVDTGVLRTLGTIFNLGEGKNTFEDYTRLSLKFFYMERGGNISYSRLKFNLPTLPQNALTVTKEVEPAGKTFLGDGEYTFSVVKADNQNELYIPAGTGFTVQKNGEDVRSGTVAADGTFTLKNGETAIFANMLQHGLQQEEYGYIVKEIVDAGDNKAVQKVEYQIGSSGDRQQGNQTTELSAESSNTVIFYNTVNTGTLEIEKKVTKDGKEDLGAFASMFTGDNPETFTFDVQVAGTKLNSITLKNGEKHVINNIIAGSKYVVQETGAAGYTVTYKNEINNEVGTPTGPVSGTIGAAKTAKVTAINDFRTITPTTTITKHIANPDGGKHTYTFNWWEVTNVDDKMEPEAANKKTVTIENVEKSTESAQIPLTTVSTLDFVNEDGTYVNEGSKVFYYRFVEVPDSTGKSVHDPAVYVVELTVTNDNGTLSETRKIYKNGTQLTGNAPKMEFTNILLKDLTIEKKMGKDSENINNSGYLLNVVINSNHFRKGMEIKVKDTDKKVSIANDTTTSVTLTDISIGADESVTISGIPYDSTYTITENNGYGYNATYKYSTETKVDNKTVGVMHGETPVGTVTNTNLSDAVTISGTKKVSNPDKHEHTFTFALEQVKDAEGTPLADTGKRHKDQSIDVKVSGQKADFSFGELTYETSDLAGGTVKNDSKVKTFYYMVTETTQDDWKTLDADETEFIVEVTLTGKQGELKAEITDILENDVSKGADYPIEFRNTLLGSLTVKKSVVGGGNPSDSFKFRLKLDKAHDGTYLAEQNDVDTTLTIKNGLAEFWLRRNEEITIYGLPHGLEVEVYEFDAEEYRAYHKIDTSLTRKGQTANAKVSTDGTTVKYINYDIDSEWLPQTGQLKWPVLVLAALGIGLLGFGALSRKRKRNGK